MTADHANPLLITQTGDITTLTLNRPNKCNALNLALIKALCKALTSIAQDNHIKLVILKGAGTHFCAGADLNMLHHPPTAKLSPSDNTTLTDATEQLSALFHQLYHLPQPTLACVQGAALGGGAGLVACCDWCIASETASFGFPEVRRGLIPAIIAPYVNAAIGPRLTKNLFMTGETLSAHQAKQIGLVHNSVKSATLKQAAEQFCQTILANKAHAVQGAKALLNTVIAPISTSQQEKARALLASLCASDETQKGLNNFLNTPEK